MEFDCTEEEFRVFEKLVEDEEFAGSFPMHLELVLLGVKPGATPAMYLEVETFREEIEEMGLCVKVVDRDYVDLEDAPDYARDQKWDRCYFVARDPERFEMLQEAYNDREKFDRDFALFLGYPEDDINWFIESGKEEAFDSFDERKDELKSIVNYTGYIPRPEKRNIERARETAERFRNALLEADERFDSSAGSKLIEFIEDSGRG